MRCLRGNNAYPAVRVASPAACRSDSPSTATSPMSGTARYVCSSACVNEQAAGLLSTKAALVDMLGNMIAKRLMSALLLFGIATVNATTFYTRHIHLGRALQQAQRLRGGADEIGCIFDDRTERTQEEWALLKQQQSATTHSAEIFGSL
eukprot:3801-Heterococcus_DN1.PRE.1